MVITAVAESGKIWKKEHLRPHCWYVLMSRHGTPSRAFQEFYQAKADEWIPSMPRRTGVLQYQLYMMTLMILESRVILDASPPRIFWQVLKVPLGSVQFWLWGFWFACWSVTAWWKVMMRSSASQPWKDIYMVSFHPQYGKGLGLNGVKDRRMEETKSLRCDDAFQLQVPSQ